jgi:hypothetical protein
MANQTLDNFLFFSNGFGCIQANDPNHQIILRGDRNGTASDYTNYYQYGGTLAAGLGHKFWTGGVLASQTLKFQIADDKVKTYIPSQFDDSLGFGDKGYISWGGTPARLIMTSCGSADMALGTDYFVDRFTIKASTGFIGVGTKSPDARFTVACGDMNIKATSSGNSGKLYFGDEVTSGPGKAIFMETYFMKIQGHRNEGVIIQGVNASGCVREFARFYGDCSSYPNQIHLVPTCGNVGIGTSSPGSKLDICGADGRIQSRVDSSDGSTINVRPNAGKCGWISYTEDAVADRWGIGVKNGDSKLYFASGNVGVGGGTTRMVIDGGGSVGLGTTTPCTRLSVKCSTGSIKIDLLSLTTTDGAGSQPTMRFDTIEANCNVLGRISVCDIIPYAGVMIFETSGCKGIGSTTTTELMRLVGTTGNVGINTASPSYRLHVNGTFYAAGSSVDYKQDVCQYNTDSCMFMKLIPVTYQYKDEYTHLGKELKSGTQIGLIAEDVAEVYPELAILVNEEDDKVVRNVDYEKLSIILLSELQKLRAEVDELKSK